MIDILFAINRASIIIIANCRNVIKLALGSIDQKDELKAYNNIATSNLDNIKSDIIISLRRANNMVIKIAQLHGATKSPDTIAIGKVRSNI